LFIFFLLLAYAETLIDYNPADRMDNLKRELFWCCVIGFNDCTAIAVPLQNVLEQTPALLCFGTRYYQFQKGMWAMKRNPLSEKR
jgi:hypothetical protein